MTSDSTKINGVGVVRDLLEFIGNRTWPVVLGDASIDDVVEALSLSTYSHIVFVIDDAQVLQGVITEEMLVKHLFIHYHDDMILDTRALISCALSEHASDLAKNERLKATVDQDIDFVLAEMIDCKVDEVPVIDDEGRMLGDITMKDIIRYRRHMTPN